MHSLRRAGSDRITMPETKMVKEGKVRLTEEAHGLCADMACVFDTTMKDVASEAVTRMAERQREERRYAWGTFVLGAIAGGVLMFVVGVLL